MVKHTIRCGNSNTIYQATLVPANGRTPVAPKRTTIHFGSPLPAVREFRVIARLSGGDVALSVVTLGIYIPHQATLTCISDAASIQK